MATAFDGAYFKYPVLLVLANRVVSCVTAAVRLMVRVPPYLMLFAGLWAMWHWWCCQLAVSSGET